MKKILLVTLLGGLALVAFFMVLRRGEGPGAAPTVAVQAGPVGVTPVAPPTTPPAPAAPPPPSTAAPALTDPGACQKLADLCSSTDKKVDPDQCERDLADARKMSGPVGVERSERCLAEATTCAAATGCLSGGVGMGALGEYLKGFGAALSR